MSKDTKTQAPTTGSGVRAPTSDDDAVLYDPHPLTLTVLHRVLVWAEGAVAFDDAVNDAAQRVHQDGGRIAKREFCHVGVGDREVVLICHLTYHVPVAEDEDAD